MSKELLEESPKVGLNSEKKTRSVTYMDMRDCHESLWQARHCMTRMKGDVVFNIMENIKITTSFINEFELKRKGIIDFYAEKDEQGNVKLIHPSDEEKAAGKRPSVVYPEGNELKCRDELRGLLNTPVEGRKPFKMISLASFNQCEIDTKSFQMIEHFIDTFVREK